MMRVEATFKASRNMVANSSTVGKDEKSSGLRVLMEIMMITRLIIILKVNKKSNKSAGKGSTSMAMINNTSTGIPRPARSNFAKFCRIVDRLKVLIVTFLLFLKR